MTGIRLGFPSVTTSTSSVGTTADHASAPPDVAALRSPELPPRDPAKNGPPVRPLSPVQDANGLKAALRARPDVLASIVDQAFPERDRKLHLLGLKDCTPLGDGRYAVEVELCGALNHARLDSRRVVVNNLGVPTPLTLDWRPAYDPLEPFAQASEFPCFLLPETLRGVRPEAQLSARDEQIVSDVQTRIAKAVGQLLKVITVPLVIDGTPRMVPFFATMQKQASAVDANARVMPGGGVVRAILAYVTQAVTSAGSFEAGQAVLDAFAAQRTPLPGYKVLGPGSDFDMLLDGSHEDTVAQQITAVANSAEKAAGARADKGSLKRGIFAVADVKGWKGQLERATAQGGSELDWLAYDLTSNELVLPASHPHILRDFVLGYYRYGPPRSAGDLEDADKQTVRGLRLFLEIPNLRLADERQLRTDLAALLAKVERGELPSAKAIEQFAKMTRNSWWEGANNRFFRAPAGSVEALAKEVIDKLSALLTERGALPAPLVPEFLERRSLDARAGDRRELNGLPQQALMDVQVFRQRHAPSGFVYHGTPSGATALAALRNGLFLSRAGQGRANFNRGTYATTDLAVAQGPEYAGKEGVVFALEIKADPRLNILDWPSFSADPANAAFVRGLEQRAQSQGRDPFELLAREHGIDIIINTHILLENADAVQFPDGLAGLVQCYGYQALNGEVSASHRLKSLGLYRNFFAYATALGEGGMQPPAALAADVCRDLGPELARDPRLAFDAGAVLLPILTGQVATSPEVRSTAARAVAQMASSNYYSGSKIQWFEAVWPTMGANLDDPEVIAALKAIAVHCGDCADFPERAYQLLERSRDPDKLTFFADRAKKFGRTAFAALERIQHPERVTLTASIAADMARSNYAAESKQWLLSTAWPVLTANLGKPEVVVALKNIACAGSDCAHFPKRAYELLERSSDPDKLAFFADRAKQFSRAAFAALERLQHPNRVALMVSIAADIARANYSAEAKQWFLSAAWPLVTANLGKPEVVAALKKIAGAGSDCADFPKLAASLLSANPGDTK